MRESEQSMAETVKWALVNAQRLPISVQQVLLRGLPITRRQIDQLKKRETIDAAGQLIRGLLGLVLDNMAARDSSLVRGSNQVSEYIYDAVLNPDGQDEDAGTASSNGDNFLL